MHVLLDHRAHLVHEWFEVGRRSLVDAGDQRSYRAVLVFGVVGEIIAIVDDPANFRVLHLLLDLGVGYDPAPSDQECRP